MLFYETVDALGFGHFGGQIKEAQKDRLMPLAQGVMAERRGDMGFPHSRRPYQNETAGFLQPLCVHVFKDFIPRYLWIILPVKVLKRFSPLDPDRLLVLNPLLFFSLMFFCQEIQHELFLLR
jgi:hypothetical protein